MMMTQQSEYHIPFLLCRMGVGGADSHMWLSRQGKLSLPVYLNSTRTELLFTVDLNIAPGQDQHSFYERGVAVLTSTALN
jgi:dynein heavy chain 1